VYIYIGYQYVDPVFPVAVDSIVSHRILSNGRKPNDRTVGNVGYASWPHMDSNINRWGVHLHGVKAIVQIGFTFPPDWVSQIGHFQSPCNNKIIK